MINYMVKAYVFDEAPKSVVGVVDFDLIVDVS